MPKDNERWNRRNKRLRCENDYNKVLCEYLMVKYGPIANEFSIFYDSLREKYPDRHFYKGSKRFRTWVRNQIEQYDPGKNEENAKENDENTGQAAILGELVVDPPQEGQQPQQNDENIHEAATLGELVGELVVDPPQEEQQPQQNPIENIIENGQQNALEELDALIGVIIADIENQCDEGIVLSPAHEVEVESLDYEAEIEGMDDIDFNIEDPLELELANF